MSKAKTAAISGKKPALILTKPRKGGTTKGKSSDKLSVDGHEDLITSMRERQKRIDSDSAAMKKDKAFLTEKIGEVRLQAEKDGDFHKTVLVESSDGKPAQVIFADKWSKVDVEHEAALRDGLGAQYDVLVTRGVDVKLNKSMDLEKLKKALGPKGFTALLEVAEVTEYLTFSSDFRSKRASLRTSMNDETNEFLDDLIEQAQYSPSVKLK